MPDPTRLYGRDAQPLMPFDSTWHMRATVIRHTIDLMKRLAAESFELAMTVPAKREQHLDDLLLMLAYKIRFERGRAERGWSGR